MKKTISILLACANAACAFGLAACKTDSSPPDFYRGDMKGWHIAQWDTTDGADRVVNLYKVNENDEFNTLFIPSSIVWNDTYFVAFSTKKIMVDDVVIKEESTILSEVFSDQEEATVKVGKSEYVVKLVRGELPVMFVVTSGGNWRDYPRDAEADLAGYVQADTATGEIVYDDAISSFKRRDDEKKDLPTRSYELTLETACDLYGVGANAAWTLVAMTDGAEISDATVYQALNAVGIDGTPTYAVVDLVLDCYYRGNYILIAQ